MFESHLAHPGSTPLTRHSVGLESVYASVGCQDSISLALTPFQAELPG